MMRKRYQVHIEAYMDVSNSQAFATAPYAIGCIAAKTAGVALHNPVVLLFDHIIYGETILSRLRSQSVC